MSTSIPQHNVLKQVLQSLSRFTGLETGVLAAQLGHPPKPEMGEYAFPCFAYAKENKMAPPLAAAQLAEKLKADEALAVVVEKVEAAGPFLNFHVRPGPLSASVISMIRSAEGKYGESSAGAGKTIVIDYSGPNIAKPFHVGHLMSTILGASLVRIFRALGYAVIGVNHLGDWGVQCGFQFLAWQRADPVEREKQLISRGLDYLAELYVDINSAAREVRTLEAMLATQEVVANPVERDRIKKQLEDVKTESDVRDAEARRLFKRLEDGDEELKKLWERLRGETLSYLQNSYDRLGVKFESDAGEGFYEPMLKPLLAELKASGVAVESEGALVIPMDDASQASGTGVKKPGTKPPFILLKSDEATIYGTRDLAAALYRRKTYDFYKNIYVVDVRQNSHFQMLFKALSKMGQPWHQDCIHIAFGLMQIKEGDTVMAMTTRGGSMIPLSDLLDRMVAKVRDIVRQKNPELSEEKAAKVSEAVGVGSVMFWVQARRRMSNFVFDWQQATDPSGDTGPYLQYTYARACSILRKSGCQIQTTSADLSLLVHPEEVALAGVLEKFPKALEQAAADYEPSLISSYLLVLASSFGNFLNKHRVLDSPGALRDARLVLVDTVRQVLAKGLGLLGVATPEEM